MPAPQEEAHKIFSESVVGQAGVKAIVFMSSKPDNFIAGADIDMVGGDLTVDSVLPCN